MVKYGDIGNKKLYERYEVDTDMGLMATSKIDRLVQQEKEYMAMGAGQICPHCGQKRAVFFGDPDGDHWCIPCQILADPEVRR